jgi:putative glutathione S-transferase
MGFLVDGKWTPRWYSSDERGRFLREATQFRGRVSADGSTGFPVERGRYHLYVSLACPWAHRTLVMRALKGLEDVLPVSIVAPFMGADGWAFANEADVPGCVPDTVNGARFLREIYVKARAGYTGRVTVPVLWDKVAGTIVNNESREVLRMLDHDFGAAFAPGARDFAPPALVQAIDREIDALYAPVNDGVYRAGFATTQEAYEEAATALFAALDAYEARLARQRFLLGAELTEADVCFFTTLARFDPVYHYHFKCNVRRLRDYENLWGYVRDVYQQPGVAATVNLEHIKQHYYRSHETVNPRRIVPLGPHVDYAEPHDRAKLGRGA